MLCLNAIVLFILVHFLFQTVALNKAKYVFQTSSSVYGFLMDYFRKSHNYSFDQCPENL